MRKRSNVLKKRYAIEVLRANGCSDGLIRHCQAVSKNALEIASQVDISLDLQLIEIGALLHDLGRSKTHGIEHALVGGEIAKKAGLPEEVIHIIERHIGAGLKSDEASDLGLPTMDFLPVSPEEKIVSYADNLTKGLKMGSFDEALSRLKKILGDGHPAIPRFISQHDEIMKWIGKEKSQ